MGVGSAIIGFFSALPDIMKLINSVGTWVNKVSGNDTQGFIKTVGAAMSQLNEAQTQAEREAAAKAIADAIHKLR